MSKKMLSARYFGVLFLALLCACAEKKKSPSVEQTLSTSKSKLKHASGFTIAQHGDITVVKVSKPWPGASTNFTYALVPREKLTFITLPSDAYDAIIAIPVKSMVITSTTHIPSLEALGELDVISGFPNTDLISSPATRKRIANGQIKELGNNENINTEVVLELNPEVIMGFGINDTNKAYETLRLAGIPIIYNGDWVEQTPLGKAEWIKFFAPFFHKEKDADSIFNQIETAYSAAKLLTQKATTKPTVLTGGLYKDVWYVSGGKSWMAQFLKDANTDYIWADTDNTGSIGLSLEAVLEKGQQADFWFNPSLDTSYDALEKVSPHYAQFNAFKTKNIYSNAINKGETGGLLFYELAPQRPDLVLKDLISIVHPDLLPEHQPYFFAPLQ